MGETGPIKKEIILIPLEEGEPVEDPIEYPVEAPAPQKQPEFIPV